MLDCRLRRSGPNKAVVAAADHRMGRLQRNLIIRRMKVEAVASEADAYNRPFARAPLFQTIGFRAEYAHIKLHRALDVSHRHRDMIDIDFHRSLLTLHAGGRSIRSRPPAPPMMNHPR